MQRPFDLVGRVRSLDEGHGLDDDEEDMMDTHCVSERERPKKSLSFAEYVLGR